LYRYLISNTRSTPQCLTVLYVTLRSCSKIDGYEGHVQQRNNATPSHRHVPVARLLLDRVPAGTSQRFRLHALFIRRACRRWLAQVE